MPQKPTYEELKNRVQELERFQTKFSQTEKNYHEQICLLEKVINELPFWFSLKDKEGQYLMVNNRLAAAHGTTVEAFINRTTIETPELYNGGLKKMIERDKKVLKGGKRIEVPEYPVKTSDGMRWRRLVKVPWTGKNKEILGVISWSEDITDLKKARDEINRYRDHLEELVDRRTAKLNREIFHRKKIEKKLLESEQKYRLLFKNAIDAIFITQERFIIKANPATEKIIGYSEQELKEMSFIDLIHPSDRKLVMDKNRRRLSGDEPFSAYTHRAITKTGEIIWVDVSGNAIEWEGRPASLMMIRNISEKKKLEFEKEENLKQLQNALKEIKALKGIIPICSHCKKIRNDKGAWDRLEEYIESHSAAEISHSICPECAEKYYPEMNLYD